MNGYYLFGLIVACILLIVTIVMVPIQYRYIKRMEEEKKRKKAQGKIYEDMPVQEQILHQNAQMNPLFLPANIIAHIIYRVKQGGRRKS